MGQEHTILIVEDERPLAKVLTKKFSKEGYQVTEVHNGEEGLKAALESHPSVILLDIFMPVMDGLEMLTELRKDEWGKDALVFMLTNFSDYKNIEQAEKLGAAEYLVKSNWGLEDVIAKVKEHLEKKS